MNRLFSEFFKEFSGVVLGVCETMWRLLKGHFRSILEGIWKKTKCKAKRKVQTVYFLLLFEIALASLFNE